MNYRSLEDILQEQENININDSYEHFWNKRTENPYKNYLWSSRNENPSNLILKNQNKLIKNQEEIIRKQNIIILKYQLEEYSIFCKDVIQIIFEYL